MTNAETQITNLLYTYADLIDTGNLDGAARLFEDAEIIRRPGGDIRVMNADELLAMWRDVIIIHEDGTPRTKHVITNPIIEVDEDAGTATCRSYYTVFQQTANISLQPVVAGRYLDRFARRDGKWIFASRDYSLRDLDGNMTDHIRAFGQTTGGAFR
jgi:3-phenylpropionate/cinnamic acid dioxygenase small subunit